MIDEDEDECASREEQPIALLALALGLAHLGRLRPRGPVPVVFRHV